MNNKTYQAYSDESAINPTDRFVSVSVVSGEATILNNLRDYLAEIINNEKVKEVHFGEITGSQRPVTKAAKSFINKVINDFASSRKIRIDTLTIENGYYFNIFPNNTKEEEIEHMYHILLSHIGRQWNNEKWSFYPDSNSHVNWENIISFINNTKLIKNRKKPLLVKIMENNPSFTFNEIIQLISLDEPLVQLADLFAGLARFSHEEQVDCSNIVINKKGAWQGKLKIGVEYRTDIVPKQKQCRYELIKELYDVCHKHGLYVSIRERKHLWTRKNNYPVNFWDYKK